MKQLSAFYRILLYLSLPVAVLFIVSLLSLEINSYGWLIDPSHYTLGRDFLNLWNSGHIYYETGALDKLMLFDAYNAYLKEAVDPSYPDHNWSYPPHMIWLGLFFGALPYVLAYVLWSAGGILLLFLLLKKMIPTHSAEIIIAITCPAVFFTLFAGQNGILIACLWCGLWLSLTHRLPILAGLCIALLTIKPHLGILIPIWLLICGERQTFMWSLIWIIGMLAATTSFFGMHIWELFFHHTIPVQQLVMELGNGFMLNLMPTLFIKLRTITADTTIAYAGQILLAIAVLGHYLHFTFRHRNEDSVKLIPLTVSATACITPYYFLYDMVILQVMLMVMLAPHASGLSKADKAMVIGVWALPLFSLLPTDIYPEVCYLIEPILLVLCYRFVAKHTETFYLAPHAYGLAKISAPQ